MKENEAHFMRFKINKMRRKKNCSIDHLNCGYELYAAPLYNIKINQFRLFVIIYERAFTFKVASFTRKKLKRIEQQKQKKAMLRSIIRIDAVCECAFEVDQWHHHHIILV